MRTLFGVLARIGFAVGFLAVAFLSSSIFAVAQSDPHPPMIVYGTSNAGDKVEAIIDGKVCALATALADGFWQMQIPEGGKCNAKEGATIGFTVNGVTANETEVWKAGGAPKSVATGITLTTPSATPQKAGNPGLLPSGSRASPWFALMLGLFALASLAAARAMITRG